MTERTFFRHFPDKREVLFDGEAALSEILVKALQNAPAALGPWAALFQAFEAAIPLLVENRALAEPRRRIIEGSPPLQERELAKSMALATKLASALCGRGVPERKASLAAQIGMAAFSQAFQAWLDGDSEDLADHLAHAFREVRNFSTSNYAPTNR